MIKVTNSSSEPWGVEDKQSSKGNATKEVENFGIDDSEIVQDPEISFRNPDVVRAFASKEFVSAF